MVICASKRWAVVEVVAVIVAKILNLCEIDWWSVLVADGNTSRLFIGYLLEANFGNSHFRWTVIVKFQWIA